MSTTVDLDLSRHLKDDANVLETDRRFSHLCHQTDTRESDCMNLLCRMERQARMAEQEAPRKVEERAVGENVNGGVALGNGDPVWNGAKRVEVPLDSERQVELSSEETGDESEDENEGAADDEAEGGPFHQVRRQANHPARPPATQCPPPIAHIFQPFINISNNASNSNLLSAKHLLNPKRAPRVNNTSKESPGFTQPVFISKATNMTVSRCIRERENEHQSPIKIQSPSSPHKDRTRKTRSGLSPISLPKCDLLGTLSSGAACQVQRRKDEYAKIIRLPRLKFLGGGDESEKDL